MQSVHRLAFVWVTGWVSRLLVLDTSLSEAVMRARARARARVCMDVCACTHARVCGACFLFPPYTDRWSRCWNLTDTAASESLSTIVRLSSATGLRGGTQRLVHSLTLSTAVCHRLLELCSRNSKLELVYTLDRRYLFRRFRCQCHHLHQLLMR